MYAALLRKCREGRDAVGRVVFPFFLSVGMPFPQYSDPTASIILQDLLKGCVAAEHASLPTEMLLDRLTAAHDGPLLPFRLVDPVVMSAVCEVEPLFYQSLFQRCLSRRTPRGVRQACQLLLGAALAGGSRRQGAAGAGGDNATGSHTSATELGDGLIRLPDVTVNDALSNGVASATDAALLGAVFLLVDVPAIAVANGLALRWLAPLCSSMELWSPAACLCITSSLLAHLPSLGHPNSLPGIAWGLVQFPALAHPPAPSPPWYAVAMTSTLVLLQHLTSRQVPLPATVLLFLVNGLRTLMAPTATMMVPNVSATGGGGAGGGSSTTGSLLPQMVAAAASVRMREGGTTLTAVAVISLVARSSQTLTCMATSSGASVMDTALGTLLQTAACLLASSGNGDKGLSDGKVDAAEDADGDAVDAPRHHHGDLRLVAYDGNGPRFVDNVASTAFVPPISSPSSHAYGLRPHHAALPAGAFSDLCTRRDSATAFALAAVAVAQSIAQWGGTGAPAVTEAQKKLSLAVGKRASFQGDAQRAIGSLLSDAIRLYVSSKGRDDSMCAVALSLADTVVHAYHFDVPMPLLDEVSLMPAHTLACALATAGDRGHQGVADALATLQAAVAWRQRRMIKSAAGVAAPSAPASGRDALTLLGSIPCSAELHTFSIDASPAGLVASGLADIVRVCSVAMSGHLHGHGLSGTVVASLAAAPLSVGLTPTAWVWGRGTPLTEVISGPSVESLLRDTARRGSESRTLKIPRPRLERPSVVTPQSLMLGDEDDFARRASVGSPGTMWRQLCQ